MINLQFQWKLHWTQNKAKHVEIEVRNQEFLEKIKAEIANAEIYARLKKELTDDPNANYKMLSQILKMPINRHIPIEIKRFNKRKHRKKMWMTNQQLTKVVKKWVICYMENQSINR